MRRPALFSLPLKLRDALRRRTCESSRRNGGKPAPEDGSMEMNRRQFFRACAGGLTGSSLALLGFSPQAVLAETRQFKLSRTTETRNTCPYCSVGCGLLMYSLGDKAKNAVSEVVHIEGDSDHPVNRGTLCPKGAGLLDFVRSKNRLRYPEHRAPGAAE